MKSEADEIPAADLVKLGIARGWIKGTNILDSGRRFSYPFRQLKRHGKPVTLIVGIICSDAIVLAADSQTTKGMAKIPGAQKICVVEFLDGQALVAESGSASLSNAAIEVFQAKAKRKGITDGFTIAQTAEAAIREVRNKITTLHPGNDSPQEWQDYFAREANYFELMIAYYFDGRPHLYKLNPLWCIPVPATSYFLTSGIASDLANYLLREHTQRDIDSEFASVIAVKVVRDAIDYVEGCGGPPRVALIRSPAIEFIPVPQADRTPDQPIPVLFNFPIDPVVIFAEEKIQALAAIIDQVEQQTKEAMNKKYHAALRGAARSETRDMFKDTQ